MRFSDIPTHESEGMSRPAEWQIEKTETCNDLRQVRIRHLTLPRFSVRVVEVEPRDIRPLPIEGRVDMSEPVYRFAPETAFCEIDWTDETPEDQHLVWLGAAFKAHKTLRGYFLRWKSLAPVQKMAERINLDIRACRSWSDYTAIFCDENDRTNGALVEQVRKLAAVVSTGELPVLLAMLHAADYSRVADELVDERFWRQMCYTYGECAEAVGLAIMRQ